MPQLVESLSYKSVSHISVGLDFMLALGLDYDQFGQTVGKPSMIGSRVIQYEQNPP